MKNDDPKRSCSGFTLTEVMIASLILAIGISGFGMGFLHAMRINRLAKHHYQGMSLVRNRIQRARAISYASIPLLGENFQSIDRDGNLDADGRFRRTTQATLSSNNCYEVIVSVYYPDARNQPVVEVPITMRTFIAEAMTE